MITDFESKKEYIFRRNLNMKAVIFNSGLGNRMEAFTQKNHKSMARLKDGETIFHRQIRLLSLEGITDFIVTTGPLRSS